jgi:5'-nucleotidase
MSGSSFQNRRDFLKYALGAAAVMYSGQGLALDRLLFEKGFIKLSILFTNDQHSRIEPFPASDPRHAGEGGFARRAALVETIRGQEDHVLLLDAGDIFQGTPYFNYFHGRVEYQLMSLMGYDATTFGNHDFDLGCQNIADQMPHASFDFINCNYNLEDTALAKNKKISPYKIYKKGPLKIGVLGVGIALENLVNKTYIHGIIYNDPITSANHFAAILKEDEKCDYIICLSHLGYHYEHTQVSDEILARQSKNIDLIIGGHTHTFLSQPASIANIDGKETLVAQVGWAGIWLGKADIYFTGYNKKIIQNNSTHKI